MEKLKLIKENREVVFKLPNSKVVVKVSLVLVNDWGNKVKHEYFVVED